MPAASPSLPARRPRRFRAARSWPSARAIAALLVAVGWSWFAGASARAYIRTRTTDTFVPYFWADPFQTLEAATPAPAIGISASDLTGAAKAALGAWSYPAIPCSGLSLRLGRELTDSQVAGLDGHNRIIMRVGAWCRDPVALTQCHDPSAIALTTVFTRSHPGASDDGQILEADIEVNAVDFSWAIIPDGLTSVRAYTDKYDLASALTHETGHFIGLAHSCLLPGDDALVDDQGNPAPECSNVPASESAQVLADTMYPTLNPADVSARTLTDDDKQAACEIYPPQVVGGCATAHGGLPSPGALAVALAVIGMAVRASLGRTARRRRSGRATRRIRSRIGLPVAAEATARKHS